MVSGERRVHSAQKLRDMAHGTKVAERVAVRLEGEKLHGALIAGEDARPSVEQQKALAHIFGDGGEFTLAQTQLIELAAAGALKLLNAADQRCKLLVACIRHGIVQINGVDRPCDLLGKAIRQHAAEDQHQRDDPQKRREQQKRHGNDRFCVQAVRSTLPSESRRA